MRRLLCAISPFLLAAALAMPASGLPPVVYHSPNDDGANPGIPVDVPAGASVTLHLYIDGGSLASSPGEKCYTGPNDELCGWDLSLAGTGSVAFTSFTPNGDVEYGLSGNQLRCNGGDPFVGTLGPTKIGDLLLSGTSGDRVDLTRGDVVTSQLSLTQAPLGPVVTLPEPGGIVGLLSGVGLLARLKRRTAGAARHTRDERKPPRPTAPV